MYVQMDVQVKIKRVNQSFSNFEGTYIFLLKLSLLQNYIVCASVFSSLKYHDE